MSALTVYLEVALLNHVFRNVALASPTAVYLGLLTPAGEVAGGDYARQSVGFGAPEVLPEGTAITNNADVIFPVATADWGEITEVALFDALVGGNKLAQGVLASSKVVEEADQCVLLEGALTVVLD